MNIHEHAEFIMLHLDSGFQSTDFGARSFRSGQQRGQPGHHSSGLRRMLMRKDEKEELSSTDQFEPSLDSQASKQNVIRCNQLVYVELRGELLLVAVAQLASCTFA